VLFRTAAVDETAASLAEGGVGQPRQDVSSNAQATKSFMTGIVRHDL